MDEDPPPIFVWTVEEDPEEETPMIADALVDDALRLTRFSYYDFRNPEEGAKEPNRLLHDHKESLLKAFLITIDQKPYVLGELIQEKYDCQ